ncbi:unnamed protein product [Notodromas monacha]|uniref:Uncharacterized protein n=1 Tax=Notodromas monacha TaxID=399045 RepID=A0A7R9GL77_9CRUS|nr:unnamed protein product [Notodromas monacha]CAG0924630.1 unnamed protein product [Notodromas monacha]
MMRDSMDFLGSFDADERYLMNARPRGTWNQRTRLEKLLLIFLGLLCVALVGFIIGVAVLDSKVNQLQSDIGALKSGSKTTTAPPSTFPCESSDFDLLLY